MVGAPLAAWRWRCVPPTPQHTSRVLALVVCAVLLAPHSTAAQTPPEPGPTGAGTPPDIEAAIGFVLGAPVGDFSKNVGSAVGLSGSVGAPIGDYVTLAGDLGYLWYGKQQRRVPLRSDIPEITAAVVTYNNIFTAHARLRLQRRQGRHRPYLDGLLGIRDIYTRSVLDTKADLSADYVARDVNLRDVGVSYGVGVGALLGFGSDTGVTLDVSARLMSSPRADYLVPGAIRVEGSELFLEVSRARPTLFLFTIGVSVATR